MQSHLLSEACEWNNILSCTKSFIVLIPIYQTELFYKNYIKNHPEHNDPSKLKLQKIDICIINFNLLSLQYCLYRTSDCSQVNTQLLQKTVLAQWDFPVCTPGNTKLRFGLLQGLPRKLVLWVNRNLYQPLQVTYVRLGNDLARQSLNYEPISEDHTQTLSL